MTTQNKQNLTQLKTKLEFLNQVLAVGGEPYRIAWIISAIKQLESKIIELKKPN